MNRKFEAPYEYEKFVRVCFGFGTTGTTLEQYGDPGGAANADCFGEELIHKVKAATAYSMLIMIKAIVNDSNQRISDDESRRFDQFVQDVIDAKNSKTIGELIERFQDTVLQRYFEGINGRFQLKD